MTLRLVNLSVWGINDYYEIRVLKSLTIVKETPLIAIDPFWYSGIFCIYLTNLKLTKPRFSNTSEFFLLKHVVSTCP